jgi:hypothetical protein
VRDEQETRPTAAQPHDTSDSFGPAPEPTVEQLRKEIAKEKTYLQTRYSSLGPALRKETRKKITELKKLLKKTESRDKRETRNKARQEKVAAKVGVQEAKRLSSAKNRILKALQDAGPKGCTNKELAEIALNYGARVRELRNDGWEIPDTCVHGGLYRYVLDVNKSTARKAMPSSTGTELPQESGNAD